MDKKFDIIHGLIDESRKIVLTTHLLPDGDAIGSELALYYYLLKKGKDASIINHNESPDHLTFLDDKNIIRRYRDRKEENDKIIAEADLIFVVDTNEYARLRSMEDSIRKSKAKKICIDHHLGLDANGFDAYVTDPESPATSEILYDFICTDSPDFIDKKIADNLYAGIMTDTGSFRYPRTTEKTFRICAELIKKGTDPVHVYDMIYNNIPQDKVKLLARFIDSLTFHFKRTLVIGTVTMKDFKEFHSDVKDVEGFSSFLMTMKHIKAGFLIVELPDSCKISFRSKGEVRINEFAKKYGGGGHKNAAGATVENADIFELKDKLVRDYESFISVKK